MKNNVFFIRMALVCALVSGCAHLETNNWQTLIENGNGLDNWDQAGAANWRVEDGVIMADSGKTGFLVSKNAYRDFELQAEFWAETETNSGIFFRCSDPAKPTLKSCYEVNIWDSRPDPKYATGAIVNLTPLAMAHKVGGRWNTMEIIAKGDSFTVKVNGIVAVEAKDGKLPAGPIALQYTAEVNGAKGGQIKWRNVRIRPL